MPAVMSRNAITYNLFRFFVLIIAVGWARIMSSLHQTHTVSTKVAIITCIVLVSPLIFGGAFMSEIYVRLTKWVLQHLHTTEEHRWVIALGITALCDVFLDTLDMAPFLVLSAVSMIMICVVAAGWESDRSGMTEGLLIGFGKLLVVHTITLNLFPSVLCGVVLVLAITSKLTECTAGSFAGNTLHITADSSSPTAQV